MSTLKEIIDNSGSTLFKVVKDSVEYEFNRVDKNDNSKVLMKRLSDDTIIEFNETESGWEEPLPDLEELRAQKIAEIDGRTRELISLGFEFDNKIFSLSDKAQINWLGIKATLGDPEIKYPLRVSKKGGGNYRLSKNMARLFCMVAAGTKQYWLDTGALLVEDALNANTHEQLEAVVDDRDPDNI